MKLFLPKYSSLLKALYPRRISRIDTSKAIYLTFDDGPVPEATPWVLDLLQEYNAKATFFCIGDNVKKYPDIFRRIIKEDHCLGNHTYNHLDGWKTSASDYINNVNQAEEIMTNMALEKKKLQEKIPYSDPRIKNSEIKTPKYKLFRPPYGKIKNSQAKILKQNGFKIVMWDVISGDYDRDFSAGECFKNVTEHATAGSTIVLHDSKKALDNLKVILPQLLDFYKEKGMEFRSLKDVL